MTPRQSSAAETRSESTTKWRPGFSPTLEEAMSRMSRDIQPGGLHLSNMFSDHPYIRTADGSPGPALPGQPPEESETIWIVGYQDADCLQVAEEARVAVRWVRPIWTRNVSLFGPKVLSALRTGRGERLSRRIARILSSNA